LSFFNLALSDNFVNAVDLEQHQNEDQNCEKAAKIEEKRWIAEWFAFLAENSAEE
jgi:hypothetical protein